MFVCRALIPILISGFILIAGTGNAAMIVASSCSQSDVLSAIKSSSSGDTVMVPPGNSTWTSGVTVPDGVKLIGSGTSNTVISSSSYIYITLGSNSWFEGFKLKNGVAQPSLTTGEQDWVIKDNYFGNTSAKYTLTIDNTNVTAGLESQGVFHGNTFIDVKIVVNGKSNGQYAWYYDDDLGGTDGVVYIENNTFTMTDKDASATGDSARGGAAVWRFNTLNTAYLQTHGARNGTDHRRSARKAEWYRNNIITESGQSSYGAMWIKGGVFMAFDNDCTGSDYECLFIVGTERLSYTTQNGVCSDDDSFDTDASLSPTGATMCRDAVGAGKDVWQSPNPSSNPDSAQADQAYSPSYIWNNTYDSVQRSVVEHLDDDNLITENLDYFQGDGTKDQGITSGPLSNAPVCNAGTLYHGYWATDQGNWNQSKADDIGYGSGSGSLYQCQYNDGSYSWSRYYTPANYPHPLIKKGPATPINLSAE